MTAACRTGSTSLHRKRRPKSLRSANGQKTPKCSVRFPSAFRPAGRLLLKRRAYNPRPVSVRFPSGWGFLDFFWTDRRAGEKTPCEKLPRSLEAEKNLTHTHTHTHAQIFTDTNRYRDTETRRHSSRHGGKEGHMDTQRVTETQRRREYEDTETCMETEGHMQTHRV